jgi:hypothetical protein
MKTHPEFSAALSAFLKAAQAIVDAGYAKYAPQCCKLTTSVGPKYIRVISLLGHDGVFNDRGSVYCFVEKANGNVLKAASYATPAKHARSNIFAADFGASGVTEYGARYL